MTAKLPRKAAEDKLAGGDGQVGWRNRVARRQVASAPWPSFRALPLFLFFPLRVWRTLCIFYEHYFWFHRGRRLTLTRTGHLNMPTYEYLCEKCGYEFEQFQSISAKPLKICPEDRCAQKRWGKGRVRKLVSAGAGLLFKGSGFYITDYRSENYKQAAKKETGAAPGAKPEKSAAAEGKGSGKSESKPASSPKAKE